LEKQRNFFKKNLLQKKIFFLAKKYEPQKHPQKNFIKKIWPPALKNMLKILKYHLKKYNLHPPSPIISII